MTRRVVDAEAFARIECSRCGECCARFTLSRHSDLHDGPLGLLEQYGRAEAAGRECGVFWPVGFVEFFAQLKSQWNKDWDRWTLSCGYFSRNSDGQGLCGIHNRRPQICRDFPNGIPVTYYDPCAWNVEIVDFIPVMGVVDKLC